MPPFYEGTAFSKQISASDADGNTLTYGLSGAPSGMTISYHLISWADAVFGTYMITVTAKDPGDSRTVRPLP